jgi:hypothetical protein
VHGQASSRPRRRQRQASHLLRSAMRQYLSIPHLSGKVNREAMPVPFWRSKSFRSCPSDSMGVPAPQIAPAQPPRPESNLSHVWKILGDIVSSVLQCKLNVAAASHRPGFLPGHGERWH